MFGGDAPPCLGGRVRYDIGSVAAGIPVAGRASRAFTATLCCAGRTLASGVGRVRAPKVPAQTVKAFPEVLKLPLSAIPHVIADHMSIDVDALDGELGAPACTSNHRLRLRRSRS
jgi:hypothetical protein